MQDPNKFLDGIGPTPVVIFGVGDHGKVVLDATLAAGMRVTWLIDDAPHQTDVEGVRVLPSSDPVWQSLAEFRFIVAVGDNLTRAKIFKQLKDRGGKPLILIHPGTIISRSVQMGDGTVVCAAGVINPSAIVGENCIINTGALVDHDCVIEDHVHICPGVCLAGSVRIARGTTIGTGASIIPGIHVGQNCLVGAGAVVCRDIPDNSVAFGNPARIVRKLTEL